MPISKLDAIAACQALGDVAKDTTIDNAELHDKSHWSETNAKAALGPKPKKPVCGYYYKIHSYWFRESTGQTWKVHEPPGPKIKKTCKLVEEKLPLDLNDSFILIQATLTAGKAGKAAYYKKAEKDGRCLVLAPLPQGFGGATLYLNSANEDPCQYVAIVLKAGATQPASLVTHLPCTQGYADRFADLS
jgi:hypothetical protein